MIIILKKTASEKQIDHIIEKVKDLGLDVDISKGKEKTIIGVIGEEDKVRIAPLESLPGVERFMEVLKPYKRVSRDFHPEDTIIDIDGIKIGQGNFVVMAGPCAIENEEILDKVAKQVKEKGASILRGGAFKPRTSPYAFQGLGKQGLKYLAKTGKKYGLPVVTEVMDTRDVDLVAKYTDIIQIGARNMQNFNLLKEVGKTRKPVVLKRGLMASVKEWLMSAEYIVSEGNDKIILCERGIRTFETSVRFSLDISSIPVVKQESHLPVIVDPSHSGGKWSYVKPLAMAAAAVGADGLMVEVHCCPENALCDGDQSLLPERFGEMVEAVKPVVEVLGKRMSV